MKGGKINDFLDQVTWEEHVLCFRGERYFFNPIGDGDHATLGIFVVDDGGNWVRDVLTLEERTTIDCVRKMTDLPIWDGMTFWEAEREMSWVDY